MVCRHRHSAPEYQSCHGIRSSWYPLSAIRYPLSAIRYPLSAIRAPSSLSLLRHALGRRWQFSLRLGRGLGILAPIGVGRARLADEVVHAVPPFLDIVVGEGQ